MASEASVGTTGSMSDEAVMAATGRDREGWRAALDAIGAAKMTHKEIATKLYEDGLKGWWAQMVTVEYERMIGRRELGQTCAGDYSAGASRTVAGDKDTALAAWRAVADGIEDFDGTPRTGEPRVTQSGNWRYWRVDLADGSKVSMSFYDKPGDKAAVAVNHDKLGDREAIDRWKAYWKPLLARI